MSTRHAHAEEFNLRRPSRRRSAPPAWVPREPATPRPPAERPQPAPGTLTAVELRELRRARRLVFTAEGEGRQLSGTIRTVREARGKEIETEIGVGASLHYYAEEPSGRVTCFTMAHFVTEDKRTWMRSLRAGDRVTLQFTRDNSTDSIRAARLVRDELRLVIRRGERLIGSYLIDIYVGPGSITRMVRYNT